MKLLTPGPLTTTRTVREQMLEDRCTWDTDYKETTQWIRKELLALAHASEENYTAILMQGSGSFVVESVLTSTIRPEDRLLIITNGAYGERIVQMAKTIGLQYDVYAVPYDEQPQIVLLEDYLMKGSYTHVAVVHCETTTGILNPVEAIGEVVHQYGATFIVDAMSSFGGVPLHIQEAQIDYLISSANKCIQGVPGFGFVLAKKEHFLTTKGISRSVSLDLYDQWATMDVDGKWRFTSPTHVVAAFAQAIHELHEEGGVTARYERYRLNNQMIRTQLQEVGIHAYIDEAIQSPIITTYLFPNEAFSFEDFYEAMKEAGFILYPGKLTEVDTFRIGNIGDVHAQDFRVLCEAIKTYMGVQVG